MYISEEEGFQDFLWYSGSCNTNRTEGSWTLYKEPESPVAFVTIDWTHDWENELYSSRFEIIDENSEAYASYLEYGKTDDPLVDMYFNLYDSTSEITYSINYNSISGEGNYTDGTNTYCWDENQDDISCPGID